MQAADSHIVADHPTGLPAETTTYLTASDLVPQTTPSTDHVISPAPDAGPPPPGRVPTLRPIELPDNGGVAFVNDIYALNVRNAFPEAKPGVFRLVVENTGNAFVLPGDRGQPTSRPHDQLVTALTALPPHLAAWDRYTTIELWACRLTPAKRDQLAPALHAATGTRLTLAHSWKPIVISRPGYVDTTGIGPYPRNALHLGADEYGESSNPSPRDAEADSGTSKRPGHEAAVEQRLNAALTDFLTRHDDIDTTGTGPRPHDKLPPSRKRPAPGDDNTPSTEHDTPTDSSVVTRSTAHEDEQSASDSSRSAKRARLADIPELAAVDPETASELYAAATEELLRHGGLDTQVMVDYLKQKEILPVSTARAKLIVEAARNELEQQGTLWYPIHRGDRRSESFDLVKANPLTVFLYWQAVTQPDATYRDIASSALSAGFATPYRQLIGDAKKAIMRAEEDGNRLNELHMKSPEHRPEIIARLGQLLATPGDHSNSALALGLRKQKVIGDLGQIRGLIREHKKNGPAPFGDTTTNIADPSIPRRFLGRPLDTGIPADHSVIKKIAYTAAWADKGADDNDLINRLRELGIADSGANLADLVARAATAAAKHGDRLESLDTGNPLHQEAIRARLSRILTVTSGLHPSASPRTVVQHMRMRHITGTQDALQGLASALLATPGATLTADTATRIDLTFGAITLSTAKQVPTSANRGQAVQSSPEARPVALPPSPFESSGGSSRPRVDIDPADGAPGLWWQLAVDHPHETAAQIAHRAAQAGFSEHDDLLSHAEKAIDAAVSRQQRYPFLDISDKKVIFRVQSLIDALIIKAPEDPLNSIMTLLPLYNVVGDPTKLRRIALNRKTDLGRIRKENPRLYQEFVDKAQGRLIARNNPPTSTGNIYRTIGDILLASPALRDPRNTGRLASLLQAMRDKGLTAPEHILRGHAETMLSIRPDAPMRNSYSIPVPSRGETLHAVPIPGGIAFVDDAYAPNVLNAFPTPQPGTLRVIVPRKHQPETVFALPGTVRTVVEHDFNQLAEVIAGLPIAVAPWAELTKIVFFSCNLTVHHDSRHLAYHLHLYPHLRHVEVAIAYPGLPVYFLPIGNIRTEDDGTLPRGTLRVGPESSKRSFDATDGESSGTAKRPRLDELTGPGIVITEKEREIFATATEEYLRRGDLSAPAILGYIRERGGELGNIHMAKKVIAKARKALEQDDLLWHPVYRGERVSERFDLDTINTLTVFMYWHAATRPEMDFAAIARHSRAAGFLAEYAELVTDAKKAIRIAEEDGRRPGYQRYTETAAYADERQASLLSRPFLGESLDAGEPADLDVIKEIAYIAAWSDKTADIRSLVTRVRQVGVTDSEDNLISLVSNAVTEAEKNGDRLEPLHAEDDTHQNAIQSRLASILVNTPGLHASGRPNTVIKHMRMRNVAGSQEDLAAYVAQALRTSNTDLISNPEIDLDWNLRPLFIEKLDPQNPHHRPTIEELARKVVDEFGDLRLSTLTRLLSKNGVGNKTETNSFLLTARESAAREKSLWHPLYRGARLYGTFNFESPNDLTVLLLQLAVDNPLENANEIALRAEQAGFKYHVKLLDSAESAIKTAEQHQRRHPRLIIGRNEHKERIDFLIDMILADHPKAALRDVARALRRHNVQGERSKIYEAARNRKVKLADPQTRERQRQSEDLDTVRLPLLDPLPLFENRSVDTDRDLIMKIAYAAAWADKKATADQIVTRLRKEGVSGSQDALTALVNSAIAAATMNGDRLIALSSTDPTPVHRKAVRARIGGILRSTPELHASGELGELVRHMRMRHITGPREALKAQALVLLRTPLDALLADPTTSPDDPFGAIVLGGRANPAPEHAAGAERILLDESSPPAGPSTTQQGPFTLETPHTAAAVLWLLSVDHPHETAAQIAQRAERSALGAYPNLLQHAQSVIEAAVRAQRRYPFLHVDVPQDYPRIQMLINALFIDHPDARVTAIAAHLSSYNVAGDPEKLRTLARDRKVDLARTRKYFPDRYRDFVRDALPLLHLDSPQPFLGRPLDTRRTADMAVIESLALAAARLDKAATAETIIARLSSEGVTSDGSSLTDLVVRAMADAHQHYRHPTPPTAPADTEAPYRGIGEILPSSPRLHDRGNADRAADPLQEMRNRQITGSEHVPREHAETMLAVPADEPLPDVYSIPVTSPLGTVRAIPFAGGVAFVSDAYAHHILNAFREPKPGTLRIVVGREHRPGGAFTLPDFATNTDIRHDLGQLAEVIADVLSLIAGWARTETIEILSCDIVPEEGAQFARLVRDRTGRHDIGFTVSHPGKPAFVTPAGEVRDSDNGDLPFNTLRLGPDAPPLDIVSWRPGADRTLRDYLVNRVVWPQTSRLAGLPAELRNMVLEQFQLDPAVDTHLHAWVEAQYERRSAGNRLPTFEQVSMLSGGLVTEQEIAEILARKVVDAYGNLTPAAVRLQLTAEGIRHPRLLGPAITKALDDANSDGSAWHPTFRGERRRGRFDSDEPGPTTLLLWRLAADHPRDSTNELARRAEQAGLIGRGDILSGVDLAIGVAGRDQRRLLSAARPSDHSRIHSLIDALLLTNPGISTPGLVARLRDSVQGQLFELVQMVETRQDQLAREQELGQPAMYAETASALLSPRPGRTVLGRILDSGEAGHQAIIEHLAYATAWTHKTDTVKQLAERLREDGVTGPDEELTRLISNAVAEADRHGDRLEPLPADRPAYHHALRLRIDRIVADTPALRDTGNSTRLTQLVRQMRLSHVTGPRYLLTAHAHDAFTRSVAPPLRSGAVGVDTGLRASARAPQSTPSTYYQHLVDADGTVTAVGFLPGHEAPVLHAAAARHDLATQLGHPGARLVYAHHDHTGFTIPNPTDPEAFFHTLHTTLTHLGTNWKHDDILLVTCLPNPVHTEQLRTTAQAHGYQGTIHTTTSPHTEITEHHGARPLHPGDTPHPNSIVLNPQNRTITFAKGTHDLLAGEWYVDGHSARSVIRLGESLYDGLLNAHESGAAVPEIEVHGYGNARLPGRAMATSIARVDSVVAALLLGLNIAHENRPVADRIPDLGLMAQAMKKIVHGRSKSPLSSGRDLEEQRRGVFVRIPAFPLPAGRVPTFTYRNPSGVDVSWLEPLQFGSRDDPIRLPREFLVPPGPALALESPAGAMIFPSFLVAPAMEWSQIRKYQGVISLWLHVDHRSGEVVLRDGLRLSYRDFAIWAHEMLNGAPNSQRLLLLTDHGGEQPRRTGNQPGLPASSLAGILSAVTHGRVLTPLTGTIWTYGGEAHATSWGLFHDGSLLGVYTRPGTGNHTGTSVRGAVAAAGLEAPRHTDADRLIAEREETTAEAAAAAEAYINPPPPLPSASKPEPLPARTTIKFAPQSARIGLRYGNEIRRLFRQVYIHAQEAFDEAETFPQVVITGLEDTRSENTSGSEGLGKKRAQAVKDLAVHWMTEELEQRAARRESTFDAGSPGENRSYLESFIRLGSRRNDGTPTHEVVIELFNLRETTEEVASALSPAPAFTAPPDAAYIAPPAAGAEPVSLPRKVEVGFSPGSNVVQDHNHHLENLFRHVYVHAQRALAEGSNSYPHLFLYGLFDSRAAEPTVRNAWRQLASERVSALRTHMVTWMSSEDALWRDRGEEYFGSEVDSSLALGSFIKVVAPRARTGARIDSPHDVVIEILDTHLQNEDPSAEPG